MKHILSVSLGSSKRNHSVETEFMGEKVLIERRGTDGDIKKAVQIIKEYDGVVDAFGLGGIDLYIYAGSNRYTFKDAQKIARNAIKTPVVDGSGLKNTLERRVITYLQRDLGMSFENKKVLMVCAVDRFGMAESLSNAGAIMTFGDLMFTLGVPVPLNSLRSLERLAKIMAPVVVKLPFKMLYPTGKKQEKVNPKYASYFDEAEIIAGDFHFIRRFMPDNLKGKCVITNTVTKEDIDLLRKRGVALLVTTTPELNGRSFGTNVMEGVIVALSGKRTEQMSPADYSRMLDKLGMKPRVIKFAEGLAG